MQKNEFQQAAGISAELAERWFPHFNAAMKEFGITTTTDQAMFIAQVGHESAGFCRVVESLNYTPERLLAVFGRRVTTWQAQTLGRTETRAANQSAIANLVYGARMGNTASDDGWRYRGRGLMQITGRDNYIECGKALKLDLAGNPDYLEQDQYAARAAAWFYVSRGCLRWPGDLVRVTQIINGGQNGIDDRRARYNAAYEALTVD